MDNHGAGLLLVKTEWRFYGSGECLINSHSFGAISNNMSRNRGCACLGRGSMRCDDIENGRGTCGRQDNRLCRDGDNTPDREVATAKGNEVDLVR